MHDQAFVAPGQWRPLGSDVAPSAASQQWASPYPAGYGHSPTSGAPIIEHQQQDSPSHAPPPASAVDADPTAYTNLFVAPLPKSVRNDDLLTVFLPFRASHASVMMDVNTGRSKGFGFVAFDDPRDGYAATLALQGKCFVAPSGDTYTLTITASHHRKSACLNESRHVYFRNIPTTLPSDHVERVLSQFGRIVAMQLRFDALQRWYLACVEYEDLQGAKHAVEHGHGKVLFPEQSTFPVMVKFADTVPAKGSKKGKPKVTRRGRQPAPAAVGDPIAMPSANVSWNLGGSGMTDRAITEFLVDAMPAPAVREDPLHDSGTSSHQHQRTGSTCSVESETGSVSSGSSSGRYRRNPYGATDVIVPLE